jgi:hypothetical protein
MEKWTSAQKQRKKIMVNVFNYSETSIYRSRIIRFPGSVVQFLWSLSESYFNCGSRIYCFPGSIVSFSDPPPTKTMTRGFTVYETSKIQ